MKTRLAVLSICLTLITGFAVAQERQGGRGRGGPQQPLDISGTWTGTWSSFNPAQATSQPNVVCAKLEAKVARGAGEGVWEAVFEGDCGRPYKYSIKMEGKQNGNAVLFKGTADLGQADGGVYDWIGRANNTDFIGFYTNAFSTGFFNLKRTVSVQPVEAKE
jgi:hypothetical protein